MRIHRVIQESHPARAGRGIVAALCGTVVLAAACSTQARLPTPRPLIIHSGARLTVEPERMQEIDTWVARELRDIEEDPGFWIVIQPADTVSYPWETLELIADTAKIAVQETSPDSWTPYRIYAHLHLMAELGQQDEWLPEAPTATGYELERAILSRVSDSWLYGRAVWDTAPYAPLDELIYAKENGYLDAFILTARPDEFAEAREEWLEEDPGAADDYRAWFVDTFDREPPGLRAEEPDEVTEPPDA